MSDDKDLPMWWSAYCKATRPDDSSDADVEPEADSSALARALADHDPAISAGGDAYSAQVSVEADEATQAASLAAGLFARAAADVGLPAWPLTRLEVVTDEELAVDLEESTIPELLGISEIADLLEVSKQRAWTLANEHRDFPKPVTSVAAGPLWLRAAVDAFEQRWERKPGRPKKTA